MTSSGNEQSHAEEIASASAHGRRKRKSTFAVRKEEKEQLLREMERLQATWAELHSSFAACSPRPIKRTLREQHLSMVGLRSLLGAYFSAECSTVPHEEIHLPLEEKARRALLLRVSSAKLHEFRELVLQHCVYLPLSRPYSSNEWFESANGETSHLQFDVTPFRTAGCTVRDVYDAVGFYAQNVEIIASERLGSLTIREDEDDDTDPTQHSVRVSQRRLMSATPFGFTVDANVAVFRQHFPSGSCEEARAEHAIVVAHSIESDELYPYVPSERMRYDLHGGTYIVQVTTPDGDSFPSLIRCAILTNRATKYSLNLGVEKTDAMQAATRMFATQWSDVMITAVHERVLAVVAARHASSGR